MSQDVCVGKVVPRDIVECSTSTVFRRILLKILIRNELVNDIDLLQVTSHQLFCKVHSPRIYFWCCDWSSLLGEKDEMHVIACLSKPKAYIVQS